MASSLSPVGFPQQRFMPPSDYPPHFPDELWSRPPELSPLGNLPPFPTRQLLPPFAATHDLDILEQPPFSAPVLSMDMADDACLKEIVGKLPTALPLPMPQDPPRLHSSASMTSNVGNWITPTGIQGAQNSAGLAQSTAGLASLANLSADPGFVERAARFSSFVSKQGTDLHHQADIKGGNRLPIERMSNSWMRTPAVAMDFSPREHSAEAKTDQSGITSQSPTPTSRPGPHKDCTSSTDHTFRTQAQEASTACDQGGSSLASNAVARGPACKKKRAASKAEGAKDLDMDEVCVKRVKTGDCAIDVVEKMPKPQHSGATSGNSDASTQKTSKESAKVSDVEQPPKPDYVHVRARRGQATDSHSLAERVRREKISERMKYLQDLVPGCSKVTGKAVMLDEIINYVQSLQRQVEFLSMKLAAVYPARMEVSLETLLGKEDVVSQKPLVPKAVDVPFAADNNSSYSLMQYQQLLAPQLQETISCSAPVDVHPFPTATDTLSQTFSGLASMDTYGDCISQMSQTWEDELQNAMHMSFAQQTPLTSSSLQGPLISGQMKVEL